VYALELFQDFTNIRQPRIGADLTGVWYADDVGTYYLRQTDGNVLWWLGLSRDQGRTFANVFHGTIQHLYRDGDGEPLPQSLVEIEGDWSDVQVGEGAEPTLSRGRLRLLGDGFGQLDTTTHFTALERTGGFGGSAWTKLYDRVAPLTGRLPTGPWSHLMRSLRGRRA
jgi:hypothetical protein